MRMPLLAPLLWLLLLAGSLLTNSASADRVSLALDQTIEGRSNLFLSPDDEIADGSYEVRPRLRFERPLGRLRYSLEYSPSYNVYFVTRGIDGFDQFGRAEVSYSPVPAGTAWARADFAYYRSIRSESVDGPGGIPEVVPGGPGRVFRAFADLGYEHRLGPTTVANGTLGLQAYDYTTRSNADSIGVGGELSVVHELRSNLSLGGLAFASYRGFDELSPQPASDNTVLHAGMILRAMPLPTLTLELQAGPALLFTHRDQGVDAEVFRFRTRTTAAGTSGAVFAGCGEFRGQPLLSECPLVPAPALEGLEDERVVVDYPPGFRPPARDDETWTGFARALLRKDESWGYASLGYFRAEDASSGSGSTAIRDSVTATLMLRGGNRWSARLRGNWNQRETVDRIDRNAARAGPSPVPAGPGLVFAQADGLLAVARSVRKVTQYWLDLTLRRRLLDPLSVELGCRYLHQDRDVRQGGGNFSFDNVIGSVMFRYEFPDFEYDW